MLWVLYSVIFWVVVVVSYYFHDVAFCKYAPSPLVSFGLVRWSPFVCFWQRRAAGARRSENACGVQSQTRGAIQGRLRSEERGKEIHFHVVLFTDPAPCFPRWERAILFFYAKDAVMLSPFAGEPLSSTSGRLLQRVTVDQHVSDSGRGGVQKPKQEGIGKQKGV